jgi:hypothetical protein
VTTLHFLCQVGNDQSKDDIPYEEEPQCDFQRFLRLPKKGIENELSVLLRTSYFNMQFKKIILRRDLRYGNPTGELN